MKCICGCDIAFHGIDFCAHSGCGGECDGFNKPTTDLAIGGRIRKELRQNSTQFGDNK